MNAEQGVTNAEQGTEFSPNTRAKSLARFRSEVFDLLIIGGGITGAACARDAASRGLSVALIEQSDFASGTSSKSSKLVHGGLRYLENLEFGLVFEALAERNLLLKTAPHMVRPLPFYFPVFKGDPHGRFQLGLGMILYDLLSLFRAPGLHRQLSRKDLIRDIPFLRQDGLKGGFRYFDASMWDDVLAVEVLRAATRSGAACVNYVKAISPIWSGGAPHQGQITGYRAQDLEASARELSNAQGSGSGGASAEFEIRARRTILAAGPWVDLIGHDLAADWKTWLKPSKGVHLVFDLKRIPLPGAVVMSHPQDGRIAFVMPRPDLGQGVTIVGTTDGPTPADPAKAQIESGDVEYLLALLHQYFEPLQIKASDILSGYVGVRPLVGDSAGEGGGNLAKVSREHEIRTGPGGVTLVAGGKYTTHRMMAEEIVEFALRHGGVEPPLFSPVVSASFPKSADLSSAESSGLPVSKSAKIPMAGFTKRLKPSRTHEPVNPLATPPAMQMARVQAKAAGLQIPESLFDRYGIEAIEIARLQKELIASDRALESDPEGFPWLGAQLVHLIRTGMVTHLEDFYFRRVPIFLARADHGWPWASALAKIWYFETRSSESESPKSSGNESVGAKSSGSESQAAASEWMERSKKVKRFEEEVVERELDRLKREIDQHDAWRSALTNAADVTSAAKNATHS